MAVKSYEANGYRTDISGKKAYLEYLRVIAIFFVIFNHTNDYGFFLFSKYPTTSFQWWLFLAVSIFCKFAVPVFLGISGVLLLDKDESISIIYKKRVFKITIAFITVSLFYFIWDKKGVFDLKTFSEAFYKGSIRVSLWYFYMYIGFLMMLPFLRAMVKNLKKKDYEYLFCIAIFLMGILPSIEFLFLNRISLNSHLKNLWIISNSFIYPLAGYYVHNYLEITPKFLLKIGRLNASGILLSAYLTYKKSIIDGKIAESLSQTYFNLFVLINMLFVMCLVKYLINDKKIWKEHRLVVHIGKHVFGIYMLHGLTLRYIIKGMNKLTNPVVHPMLKAVMICMICFFESYAITYILRKIPVINKYI